MLWGLKSVTGQPAAGAAVNWLRGQIHAGLLLPGEKLPPERRLSEDIGISRVTLREALKTLETEGYIKVRRGVQGGAFVADDADIMEFGARQIARDPSVLLRLHEMRALVEPGIARLAATRREMPDMKHIDQAIAALRTSGSPAELRQGETMFRLALAEAAHNAYLLRVTRDALYEAIYPFETRPLDDVREEIIDEFAAVSIAVHERDDDAAEAGMAQIVGRDRDRLRSALRR